MKETEQKTVSRATLGRIPVYLQYLRSCAAENPTVSAASIARALGLGDVQVRKDLASVSGAGKPKIGYETAELIKRLESFLCLSRPNRAVIAGAGKLGRALLDYDGFNDYGLEIAAAFDIDPEKFGATGSGKRVYPMDRLCEFCRQQQIRIGIITVPQQAAQQVCDAMLEGGVTAIWDFAPGMVTVPEGVSLQRENLALSLAHLSMLISNN